MEASIEDEQQGNGGGWGVYYTVTFIRTPVTILPLIASLQTPPPKYSNEFPSKHMCEEFTTFYSATIIKKRNYIEISMNDLIL